ncbi:hypothetical protein B0H63DRAFT_198164 [Podospora didyma]|uniref:Heterokaryon incompatibility domain-containing protein n=1 Tax=Podospora didyma TaxID=330526 RepID=A0AAE0NGQ8_9PEZI|nr:hypothetical protein B0H63DRAFT_198164 [Podospora didyma]
MKFLDTASLELISLVDHLSTAYAVLSYTWSHPSDELTHHDVGLLPSATDWPGRHKAAYRRIVQACRRAQAHNIRYLWVDSLCVDQSSTADVVESVIASFRLVWDAALCIAYLPDLEPKSSNEGVFPDLGLENALSACRWFTRAWTLQELVAPPLVEFFDGDWNLRAVKKSTSPRPWLDMLSRVSGVDAPVLADRNALFQMSLGRRLSWASRRQTSRPEDAAYSLIGMCGVVGRLTPRYGEGSRSAFHRLQEKILKTTTDLSILAWKRQDSQDNGMGKQQALSGILADSASDFGHFASEPNLGAPFTSDSDLTFTNRGLCIRARICINSRPSSRGRDIVLVLETPKSGADGFLHIGISLKEIEPGLFVRSNPHDILYLQLQGVDVMLERICVRCDLINMEAQRIYADATKSFVSAWMDKIPNQKIERAKQRALLQGRNPQDSVPTPEQEQSFPNNRPFKRGAGETPESDHNSSELSSENDVLLFDSLPEKPELLDDSHPFKSAQASLVAMALDAWADEKKAAAVHAAKKLTSMLPLTHHTTSNFTFSIPFRAHKRARWECKLQDECDDGGDSAGSYTAETDRDEPDRFLVRSKYEAPPDLPSCPFYKRDPVQHHNCMWELELPDIRTMKQHIIVDHRLPEHCPVCLSIFESAADRDRHIVARSCKESDAPVGLQLMGVSEDQVGKLSQRDDGKEWKPRTKAKNKIKRSSSNGRRPKSTLSEEQRWFRVWDIIFPGVPRPQSAYLSAPPEREAAALRRFWRRKGPELVASELEKRGLLRWDDAQEEASLAALHASVFKDMIEESGLAYHIEDRG